VKIQSKVTKGITIIGLCVLAFIAGGCGGQVTERQDENTPFLGNDKEDASSSAHLEFKGVPIDGTLSEYVSKMQENGFTLIGKRDGVARLSGDFAGYRDCIVGVATLKQKDLVSKITVIFPAQDTWSSLASNYFALKEMLKAKYGRPFEVVEKFQSTYPPKDDNARMHEVRMDRCEYYTIYRTKKGNIELSIEHDRLTRSFVRLSYFDKINSAKIMKKAMDDL